MSYATPEGKIKQKGRAICKEMGCYLVPIQQGGGSVNGEPDDVLCAWGRYVQIEYKALMRWDTKHPTVMTTLPTIRQCMRMEECRNLGGITLVVDATNVDDLKSALILLKDTSEFPISEVKERIADHPCNWLWTAREMSEYRNGNGHAVKQGKALPRYKAYEFR